MAISSYIFLIVPSKHCLSFRSGVILNIKEVGQQFVAMASNTLLNTWYHPSLYYSGCCIWHCLARSPRRHDSMDEISPWRFSHQLRRPRFLVWNSLEPIKDTRWELPRSDRSDRRRLPPPSLDVTLSVKKPVEDTKSHHKSTSQLEGAILPRQRRSESIQSSWAQNPQRTWNARRIKRLEDHGTQTGMDFSTD